jgi:hypothetical protein
VWNFNGEERERERESFAKGPENDTFEIGKKE